MAEQTLLPWDETFPHKVVHIANPKLVMTVLWYGALSAPYGGVPVVATHGSTFYAGEAFIHDSLPTLGAVNSYGDETTAKTYALSIFVL